MEAAAALQHGAGLPMSPSLEELTLALAAADLTRGSDPNGAVAKYYEILRSKSHGFDDNALKLKESALLRLGEIYKLQGNAADFARLFAHARDFLMQIPKAKTAKLVRNLIDMLALIPDSLSLQVSVCKDAIAWATAEKRVYLRQALETRLAAMYLDKKMYSESLALIAQLLSELKRLDDKVVLVDVQLLESRVYLALRNLAKSKASLTAARTAANSIYCPPLQQASLDMQSGILNAEDRDFKTAYSYFFETLEGYDSINDPRALVALKYMLLSKILLNTPEDVATMLHQKIAAKYIGKDTDAMQAIANALMKRSLHDFDVAQSAFKDQLSQDSVIQRHISKIHDTLLEKNLLRVIEPFSRVEIAHVASLVRMPQRLVEMKLSQLILDGKIKGILDQGASVLVTFEEQKQDEAYANAIETLKKMGAAVQNLYEKAALL